MRKHTWMFVSALVAVSAPWAACGGSSASGTTSGSTGTGGHVTATSSQSSSAESSSGTSSITSSSSTSSGMTCSGSSTSMCDLCIEANCCEAETACAHDVNCSLCATETPGSDPTRCGQGITATWDALVACAAAKCNAQCHAVSTCNPVTNAGCDTALGEACDKDTKGFDGTVHRCYAPPNDAMLCAACATSTSGPFCQPTETCWGTTMGLNGTCTRWCCDDGDCGGGTCSTAGSTDGVGVCLASVDGGSGPACSAPAVAPSNGSCYTGQIIPADAGAGG